MPKKSKQPSFTPIDNPPAKSKPAVNPDKIDKRTKDKNGKKLDLLQVFKMKSEGLSFQQIANALGYSKGYVHNAYSDFKDLIDEPNKLDVYNQNRINLLSNIEYKLLSDLHDEDKRKSASLNNVAYALNNINNIRRLEAGQTTANIGVNIAARLERAHSKTKKG